MKKLNNIIVALAVVAMPIITSCDKNEGNLPDRVSGNNTITLNATSELPETKTELGGGSKLAVHWMATDHITTFWGNNTTNKDFEYSSGAGTTTASFTGTKSEESDACYALYPYQDAATIDESKNIKFILPLTQTYKKGNIAQTALPMVAYTTNGGKLQFKNLCAVVKLELTGSATIKRITLSSTTKQLSGTATVSMTYGNGNPTILMDESYAYNNVVLDCTAESGGGVTLTNTATAFYIVVPATASGVTDNSFKVAIETTTGVAIKSAKNIVGNRFNRATIVNMPKYEYANVSTTYTENGVSRGAGILIGTTIWAPVNCGYEPAQGGNKGYPYGKLYQWGRKYGQGYDSNDATYPYGSNIITNTISAEQGSSEDYKDKFIKIGSEPFDWCNPSNSKLWNSGTEDVPIKTSYDPCPVGWRVPTIDELEALMGNKNNKGNWVNENNGQAGVWYDGTTNTDQTSGVFLPAAGYRDEYGAESERGVSCNYYSLVLNIGGDLANILLAYKYEASVDGSIYSRPKSSACSVRCVKE